MRVVTLLLMASLAAPFPAAAGPEANPAAPALAAPAPAPAPTPIE